MPKHDKRKKRSKRKMILYFLLGTIVLATVGIFCGIEYLKAFAFAHTPNTLSFEGELHPASFVWSGEENDGHVEPHAAILIPVTILGIEQTLYMQFDTGSPSTFLLSGPLKSLGDRGVEFELFEDEDQTRVRKFEIGVGQSKIVLTSGRVRQRDIEINWDDPDAGIKIGTIGADFIDQRVCEIDFPAQEIRLHTSRPESVNALGSFTPFKFKGRRIMLPAKIDGVEMELFYDSGCSAFGFLTSKYHYDSFSDEGSKETSYNANRHGDPVFIHHKTCDALITLGDAELPLERVSYAELYNFLQVTIGRVVNGGFFGNKSLVESTLVLDGIAKEFLVVPNSRKDLKKLNGSESLTTETTEQTTQ